MEDNKYLWDRTGEVDPEILEIEEVLGTLRYQPRPLRIPADIQISRRRTFFPPLASAAAIALIAVAVGIWFSLSRHQSAPSLEARSGSPSQPQREVESQPKPDKEFVQAAVPVNEKPTPRRQRERSESLVARNPIRSNRGERRQPALTPQELAEKEQLVAALRLVSAKLNIAQRRMQGPSPQNVIRNHRIG